MNLSRIIHAVKDAIASAPIKARGSEWVILVDKQTYSLNLSWL